MKTEEILLTAEHVNLIGPGSRTHDLHDAIERFYRIATEMAVAEEREACIDIVAMHGGSIEIEAAIRARSKHEPRW